MFGKSIHKLKMVRLNHLALARFSGRIQSKGQCTQTGQRNRGGEVRAARILLAKYFFNRSMPIGTGHTGTNWEWKRRKDQRATENRSK